MKRIILSFTLLAALSIESQAASVSLVLSNTIMTNVPFLSAGPAKIQSVIITASTTNVAQVQFVDTFTNQTLYTNAAYIGVTSYATNYITNWVNYYGYTNWTTNLSLMDVTNTVAGTTNLWPVPLICSVSTNLTSTVFPVNAVFVRGVWVTNTAGGVAILTINYTQ